MLFAAARVANSFHSYAALLAFVAVCRLLLLYSLSVRWSANGIYFLSDSVPLLVE